MMHWFGDYGMGFGFGWLFMILFWVLVILGIIYLVKLLTGGAGPADSKETAEDILKKRFARGELSREEFEQALQLLRQHYNFSTRSIAENYQNKTYKEVVMKKKIFLAVLAIFMAIGVGLSYAHMMGSGQHMNGSQSTETELQETKQTIPYHGYPHMMGYGYGMGPGMMGYGQGMYPGMMGYSHGMHPGMMEHGMGHHPMMHGYGYPGMMGGCGGWYSGAQGEYAEKFQTALNETQELRRKMHSLQFEYNEALRNPDTTDEKKKEMAEELFELHEEIHKKMHQ